MSATMILLIAVFVLLALILSNVPVAFSLLASGAIGLVLLRNSDYAFNTLADQPFNIAASFTLTLIPMFIIMGMFVVQAGMAKDVYALAARVFARTPAGLGYATVAACAGFAAVTGSSAATVATIGRISVGEMRRNGYNPGFAAAIVAAAGTLGILIPPSVVLVIYGTLSGESIGELLIAGIIPGILSAFMYAVVVWWRSGKEIGEPENPVDGIPEAREGEQIDKSRQVFAAIKIGVLFTIVIGGIYSGIFTATESGANAAAAAMIIFIYSAARRREVRFWKGMREALQETTAVSSMIFMLLIGGGVFAFFMASGGYARDFAYWATELQIAPMLIIVVFLLIMIPLGMILDSLSIILITVPLLHPVALEFGFDGIWFAILVVKTIELGLITPPVGLNVFVVSGAVPDVSSEQVFRAVWPFVIIELVTVSILFAIPQLVTWLPSMIS